MMENFSTAQPWKLYTIRTGDSMRFDAYNPPRHFPSSRYRASSVQHSVVPTSPPRIPYPPFLASLLHPQAKARQEPFPLSSIRSSSTAGSSGVGLGPTRRLLRALFSSGALPVVSSPAIALLPRRKHSTFLSDHASLLFSSAFPSSAGSRRSRQIRRVSLLVVFLLLWGLFQSRRVRRFLAAVFRRLARFLRLLFPSHSRSQIGSDHGNRREDEEDSRGAGQPRRRVRRDRHSGTSSGFVIAEEGAELPLIKSVGCSVSAEPGADERAEKEGGGRNLNLSDCTENFLSRVGDAPASHCKPCDASGVEGRKQNLERSGQIFTGDRAIVMSFLFPQRTERWLAKSCTAPGSLVSRSSGEGAGDKALYSAGYPHGIGSGKQIPSSRPIFWSSSAGDLRDKNGSTTCGASTSSIHDALCDLSLYIEAASSTPAHISPEPVNTNVPSCFFLPSLASSPFYSSQSAVGQGSVSSSASGTRALPAHADGAGEELPGLRSSFDVIPSPSSVRRDEGRAAFAERRRRESLTEKFIRSVPPLNPAQGGRPLPGSWMARRALAQRGKGRDADHTAARLQVSGDAAALRPEALQAVRNSAVPFSASSVVTFLKSVVCRRGEASQSHPANSLVVVSGKDSTSTSTSSSGNLAKHGERLSSTGTTTPASSKSETSSESVSSSLSLGSVFSSPSAPSTSYSLAIEKRTARRPLTSLQMFRRIVRLAFPGLISAEGGCLVLLVGALVFRTFLSIWIASLNGGIVETIVEKDLKKFLRRLANLIAYALPAAAVNAGIQFLEKMLALMLRRNLTRRLMRKYLRGLTFYQMSALDTRLPHPDEVLTSSLSSFTILVASLFSSFLKPLVDIVFLSRTLIKHLGVGAPLTLVGWYILTAAAMHAVAPPLGKKTARLQELEGKYRALQADVLQHSEEIAFYGGSAHASRRLSTAFDGLFVFKQQVLVMYHLIMGSLDTLLAKHLAVVVGYAVVAAPTFRAGSGNSSSIRLPQWDGRMTAQGRYEERKASNASAGLTSALVASGVAERGGGGGAQPAVQITHDYIRNSSLLINLAKAIGRIVMAYKDVQQLAGITSRVHAFLQVLDDLRAGVYCSRNPVTGAVERRSLSSTGQLIEEYNSSTVEFKDVDVVTPGGSVLLEGVTFAITPGKNVFLLGPNGCGKTSLFRILGGLWPLISGEIHKPVASKLFYIPQRPYMPEGTLRDQVIYPMVYEDFRSRGGGVKFSDQTLEKVLEAVGLLHVLRRYPEGWETWAVWQDVLSGGEKQRMAFARLLFHRPVFAILDEATSAVSVDVEGALYRKCREAEITLITISHNMSLLKYHDFVLRISGKGGLNTRQTASPSSSSLAGSEGGGRGEEGGEGSIGSCRLGASSSSPHSKGQPAWSFESTEGLRRLDSYSFLLNLGQNTTTTEEGGGGAKGLLSPPPPPHFSSSSSPSFPRAPPPPPLPPVILVSRDSRGSDAKDASSLAVQARGAEAGCASARQEVGGTPGCEAEGTRGGRGGGDGEEEERREKEAFHYVGGCPQCIVCPGAEDHDERDEAEGRKDPSQIYGKQEEGRDQQPGEVAALHSDRYRHCSAPLTVEQPLPCLSSSSSYPPPFSPPPPPVMPLPPRIVVSASPPEASSSSCCSFPGAVSSSFSSQLPSSTGHLERVLQTVADNEEEKKTLDKEGKTERCLFGSSEEGRVSLLPRCWQSSGASLCGEGVGAGSGGAGLPKSGERRHQGQDAAGSDDRVSASIHKPPRYRSSMTTSSSDIPSSFSSSPPPPPPPLRPLYPFPLVGSMVHEGGDHQAPNSPPLFPPSIYEAAASHFVVGAELAKDSPAPPPSRAPVIVFLLGTRRRRRRRGVE